jgi:hypothetical protein
VAVEEAENVALARTEAATASGVKAKQRARLRLGVRFCGISYASAETNPTKDASTKPI